jgi:hypothetical protein
MGISKADPRFATQALFVDYEFERVMFRWDPVTQRRYRKPYGGGEHGPVAHDDELYNQALLYGREISEAEYAAGKPHKPLANFRFEKP